MPISDLSGFATEILVRHAVGATRAAGRREKAIVAAYLANAPLDQSVETLGRAVFSLSRPMSEPSPLQSREVFAAFTALDDARGLQFATYRRTAADLEHAFAGVRGALPDAFPQLTDASKSLELLYGNSIRRILALPVGAPPRELLPRLLENSTARLLERSNPQEILQAVASDVSNGSLALLLDRCGRGEVPNTTELKAFAASLLGEMSHGNKAILSGLEGLDAQRASIGDWLLTALSRGGSPQLGSRAVEAPDLLGRLQAGEFLETVLRFSGHERLGQAIGILSKTHFEIGDAVSLAKMGLEFGLPSIGATCGMFAATGGMLGAACLIGSLLGPAAGPQPYELVLDELTKLRSDVAEINTRMSHGFDRIDRQLNAISGYIGERFDRLEDRFSDSARTLSRLGEDVERVAAHLTDVDRQLGTIRGELREISDKLTRQESFMYAVFKSASYGQFAVDETYYTQFKRRFRARSIPDNEYRLGATKFLMWGTDAACRAPQVGQSYRDNLDLLIQEARALGHRGPWLSTPLPNLSVWRSGAAAYLSLATAWPERAAEIDTAGDAIALAEVGQAVLDSLRALWFKDDGAPQSEFLQALVSDCREGVEVCRVRANALRVGHESANSSGSPAFESADGVPTLPNDMGSGAPLSWSSPAVSPVRIPMHQNVARALEFGAEAAAAQRMGLGTFSVNYAADFQTERWETTPRNNSEQYGPLVFTIFVSFSLSARGADVVRELQRRGLINFSLFSLRDPGSYTCTGFLQGKSRQLFKHVYESEPVRGGTKKLSAEETLRQHWNQGEDLGAHLVPAPFGAGWDAMADLAPAARCLRRLAIHQLLRAEISGAGPLLTAVRELNDRIDLVRAFCRSGIVSSGVSNDALMSFISENWPAPSLQSAQDAIREAIDDDERWLRLARDERRTQRQRRYAGDVWSASMDRDLGAAASLVEDCLKVMSAGDPCPPVTLLVRRLRMLADTTARPPN